MAIGRQDWCFSEPRSAPHGGWPDVVNGLGDAMDKVARLKVESQVPLSAHGCRSFDRASVAAGPVDREQVTLFPFVLGDDLVLGGARVCDFASLEIHLFDGGNKEFGYHPTLHWA